MLAFWSDKVMFMMKMFLLCKLISSKGWILDALRELRKSEYRNFSAMEHDFPGLVIFASGY